MLYMMLIVMKSHVILPFVLLKVHGADVTPKESIGAYYVPCTKRHWLALELCNTEFYMRKTKIDIK